MKLNLISHWGRSGDHNKDQDEYLVQKLHQEENKNTLLRELDLLREKNLVRHNLGSHHNNYEFDISFNIMVQEVEFQHWVLMLRKNIFHENISGKRKLTLS